MKSSLVVVTMMNESVVPIWMGVELRAKVIIQNPPVPLLFPASHLYLLLPASKLLLRAGNDHLKCVAKHMKEIELSTSAIHSTLFRGVISLVATELTRHGSGVGVAPSYVVAIANVRKVERQGVGCLVRAASP